MHEITDGLERVDSRAEFRSEWANLRPDGADLRLERADLRHERNDFRFEKTDLGPERAALRPELADLRSYRTGGGDKGTNKQTTGQKSPCGLQDFVLFRDAAQEEQGQIHENQSRVQLGRGSH